MEGDSPQPDRSVLIVEDDASLRSLISAVLRRQGIETATASDGAEAIECLESHLFAVLSLDLMMPRVNGWQVISWLKEHPDRKPHSVLVVTATDRKVTQSLDAEIVNAVFFKPFDVDEYGAYVANCTRRELPDRRRKRLIEY